MATIDWTPPPGVHRILSWRAEGASGKADRAMLHEFISSKRVDIIARTKAKVKARKSPSATEAELTQGIPLFFDQLIEILKGPKRHSDELNAAATQHGEDLLRLGFTIGQVVHDYGDVCQAVTELALDLNAKITVDEFHTLR